MKRDKLDYETICNMDGLTHILKLEAYELLHSFLIIITSVHTLITIINIIIISVLYILQRS
jgi:hypothetical protein